MERLCPRVVGLDRNVGHFGAGGSRRILYGHNEDLRGPGREDLPRDESGWTRLSPAPHSESAPVRVIWGDRPVVERLDVQVNRPLLAHEPSSDTWEDLHVPAGFGAYPILAFGGDLYVGGYPRPLARLHGGVWTVYTASPPLRLNELSPTLIREANGAIYVIGDIVRVLSGDHLTQDFEDLDPRIKVDDIAAIGGKLFLLVRDSSRSDEVQAAILTPVPGGYQTVVTEEDFAWTLAGSYPPYPNYFLAVVGDTLLFGGLSLERGQLRAQTGRILPRTIDLAGRFGADDAHAPSQTPPRGPLFVPFPRVRKNLAAVADTMGYGDARYRSDLTIANFSTTSPAVARIFPGASTEPVMEVPLGPGVQTRIEDPIPGFVGPVAVEFEGLTDEKDAWAGVRVWSPSDSGTSGTSIVATNPGDLPAKTVVIPPPVTPGSRTHIAFAASGDGPGWNVGASYYKQFEAFSASQLAIPNGGFEQVGPPPELLAAPLVIQGGSGADDLLGYVVRNEAGTNDGAIVPFEPPDTLPGRRTRFLPAVVATTSQFGRYRTELSLGWRSSLTYPPAEHDFTAMYRDGNGSWTFPFSIGQGQILSVDDVGPWLAGNGVPVDPASFVGTLTFSSDRPEGAADLLVTAVVLAQGPEASGNYGVSVPVVSEVQWAAKEAIVPALREDASFRSNVALANPEPEGGPSVTLSSPPAGFGRVGSERWPLSLNAASAVSSTVSSGSRRTSAMRTRSSAGWAARAASWRTGS